MFSSHKSSKDSQKLSEKSSSGPAALFEKTGLKGAEFLKKGITKFNLSSIFKKKKRGFVGLDIGASAIKVLKVSHHGLNKEIESYGIEEIGLENYESAKRVELIKSALMNFKKAGKLDGSIIMTFHDQNTNMEFLRFPDMPAGELDNAVKWEIKERFSFDPEKSVYDYTTLGKTAGEGDKEIEVLISMGTRKKIIDYVDIMHSVGLKPYAIEPNTMAMYEAFMEGARQWNENEVVGLLDLGAKLTTFSIIQNDNLYLARDSFVTGSSLTKAIADYCQLDINAGELHKRNYGMSKMVLEEE